MVFKHNEKYKSLTNFRNEYKSTTQNAPVPATGQKNRYESSGSRRYGKYEMKLTALSRELRKNCRIMPLDSSLFQTYEEVSLTYEINLKNILTSSMHAGIITKVGRKRIFCDSFSELDVDARKSLHVHVSKICGGYPCCRNFWQWIIVSYQRQRKNLQFCARWLQMLE